MSTERKDVVEHLSCALTEDELARYSQEMAELNQRKVEVEAEKKESMKDYGAKLQHLESNVNLIGRKIITKKEARDVNCFWEFDYTTGEKTLTRMDTGEIVKKETISAHERQKHMEFIESKNEEGEISQAIKEAKDKPAKKKGKCSHCGAKEGKEHFSTCPNAEAPEVAEEDKSCSDCGAPEGEQHSDGCPTIAEEEAEECPPDGPEEEIDLSLNPEGEPRHDGEDAQEAPGQSKEELKEESGPTAEDIPEGSDCYATFDSNDAECANCDQKQKCFKDTPIKEEPSTEGPASEEEPASEEAPEKSGETPFYTCRKCGKGFDEYVDKGEGVWECPHCNSDSWM